MDVTRRRALGLTGGALGLVACASDGREAGRGEAPAVYPGEVAFEHGVASGDPLPDGVVLWTRVTPKSGAGPVAVGWAVFDSNGRPVDAGTLRTSAARDYCVKIAATGLDPGQRYIYRFTVNSASGEVVSPTGRTRTAPASDAEDALRFAIVSCSNYPFGHFHAYREIAARDDLDAVIHLGDYIYEYGVDGYGGSVGEAIGRHHDPVTETVTLDDYRARHAQYKSDPDLQAAHAAAPWLCTWDDHESTNNAYRTGAENHNPEENEGDWSVRKQAAVQAYLEWMPVRDPAPGRARESIYRRFDFGKVASVFCLESRLTGRSEEISWITELGGVAPEAMPQKAMDVLQRVADDERTMLGAEQEAWLAEGLADSAGAGTAWQVLANQVLLARIVPPDFTQTLSPQQIAAIDNPLIQQLVAFSQLGLPFNLDAWDGFPAARDRLYRAAGEAGARLVAVTGDTHTAWGSTLTDMAGRQRGIEIGTTSVTSPGFGAFMPGVDGLGDQFEAANPEVAYHDPHGNGFAVVTLTLSGVRADYVKVSDVRQKPFTSETVARMAARRVGDGMTPLEPV